MVDVGLLGCMAGLRHHTLLDGNDLFVEFKGALTEQYVCQQLKTIEDLDILSRKILTRSFCSHFYDGLQKRRMACQSAAICDRLDYPNISGGSSYEY